MAIRLLLIILLPLSLLYFLAYGFSSAWLQYAFSLPEQAGRKSLFAGRAPVRRPRQAVEGGAPVSSTRHNGHVGRRRTAAKRPATTKPSKRSRRA